ncbi:hypothetical protein [Oleiharenicola lentus]|uniref:hypothetical protein n=1 Tax=Oleiharenicola lentus TaxID=2508720 RepID=UPI003F673565
MPTKKIERALYGPSTTEVAVGALLGLLLGVVLAAAYLVFKPVQTVKEMPKETTLGTVYYLTGSESSAKNRTWQAKQTKLIAGTSVEVVEDELNAWAGSLGAQPVVEGKEAPSDGLIIPGRPNFRVIGEQLQIGVPVTLDYFGTTFDTVVIATGRFEKSGGNVVFKADKVYLGSCPLHLIPGAGGLLVSNLISKAKTSDELRSAWAKVDGVTIAQGTIQIAVQ